MMIKYISVSAFFLAAIHSLPTSGASLKFLPAGTQLDSDPIADASTTGGEPFTFFLQLDTVGLSNPLVLLEYEVVRDFSELPTPPESFEFFNEDQLSFQDFAIDENNDTLEATIRLVRGDGGVSDGGVAPNTMIQLQRDTYRVTDGLINDGRNDFAVVEILRAEDSTGADVSSLFLLSSGIDVQPVPEPTSYCILLGLLLTRIGSRPVRRTVAG